MWRNQGLEAAITSTDERTNTWLPWVVGGAALAAVLVVVAAVLYFTVLTVGVTVDGRPVRLRAGSTVADLYAQQLVERHPGNLVSVRGHKVLQLGAGLGPYVESGGSVLATYAPLVASAQLTSHNGSDTLEPTRIATETIDPPIRYSGSGVVETVITSGTPGVRQLTIGTISGEVAGKRTLIAAVPSKVARSTPHTGRVVALTFDDGPWPGSTSAILKILKDNHVKATFFEIGRQARQMPALSRSIAAAGMEMGNHSETHPLNLGRLSAAGVANEITAAQRDITHASGQAPVYFRPPGGNTTAAMYPVLTKLNLGWVQWDIDTDDWKRPPAAKIVSKVLANVRPGSVVLMHDGGGDRSQTVKALPTIIKALKAQGYVFVPMSALKSVPHKMG